MQGISNFASSVVTDPWAWAAGAGAVGINQLRKKYKKEHSSGEDSFLPANSYPLYNYSLGNSDMFTPISIRTPNYTSTQRPTTQPQIRFGGLEDLDWTDPASAVAGAVAKKLLIPDTREMKERAKQWKQDTHFVDGISNLLKAKQSSLQSHRIDYLNRAEHSFEQAARRTRAGIHQADAWRYAGIAAKLNGKSPAIINEYLQQAHLSKEMHHIQRYSPTIYNDLGVDSSGPGADYLKEFVAEAPVKIGSFFKNFFSNGDIGEGINRDWKKVRTKIMPHVTTVEEIDDNIREHASNISSGYESDTEWLKGRSTRNTGTGKRHEFSILM